MADFISKYLCRDIVGLYHDIAISSVGFGFVTTFLPGFLMSMKVIYFQSIFPINFYLIKTDLCAEMWNNSPNCYAAGNARER